MGGVAGRIWHSQPKSIALAVDVASSLPGGVVLVPNISSVIFEASYVLAERSIFAGATRAEPVDDKRFIELVRSCDRHIHNLDKRDTVSAGDVNCCAIHIVCCAVLAGMPAKQFVDFLRCGYTYQRLVGKEVG
jgi:hypothetical protein